MSAIGEYIHNQRGIFQTFLKMIIKSSNLKKYPDHGKYIYNWVIYFKDDSILETVETLIIENNILVCKRYGYEYKRPSGFFFFYELDKEGSNKIEQLKKPKYHLHIGVRKEYSALAQNFPELIEHSGPHYKVPPTTIDEIVGMIILNFFPDNLYLLDNLDI